MEREINPRCGQKATLWSFIMIGNGFEFENQFWGKKNAKARNRLKTSYNFIIKRKNIKYIKSNIT